MKELQKLPLVNFHHVSRLTDTTGIIQHAVYTIPNLNEGYTTDDNARALIAVVLDEQLDGDVQPEVVNLGETYLAFLWHAFHPETQRFRNFMGYDRWWLEAVGSEDSNGRALWSLGTVVGNSKRDAMRSVANILFTKSLAGAREYTSLRSCAFALLGIAEYRKYSPDDPITGLIGQELSQRLMDRYRVTKAADWLWFEDIVTYCNARLPQALLVTGGWLDRKEMIRAGLESLEWLISVQKSKDGHFSFVGNQGFFRRGGRKAAFDQQPVEACAMLSACLTAYRLTGEQTWFQEAEKCFEWFTGANDLGLSLYDDNTGGCQDGLQPDRVNQNQGAESTLAYLLARLEFRGIEKSRADAIHPEDHAAFIAQGK